MKINPYNPTQGHRNIFEHGEDISCRNGPSIAPSKLFKYEVRYGTQYGIHNEQLIVL